MLGREIMPFRKIYSILIQRNPFPGGTLAVGAGLLIAGITAYGFLVVAARALSSEAYASLSVLWAMVFLIGPGVFFPVEQELARATAARRQQGSGSRPLVVRASLAAAAMAAIMLVALGFGGHRLTTLLFDGDRLLLLAFAISTVAYAMLHVTRGFLSGHGLFVPYGMVMGADGIIRLAVCLVLVAIGARSASAFGLVFALAPAAASLIVLKSARGVLAEGPQAPWGELSSALGYLLAGSVLAQFLVNAGPLVVKVLSTSDQRVEAGRFLSGLIVARVPLFLFQAVQAALLPRLSGLATAQRFGAFRKGLFRLTAALLAVGVISTLGAWVAGPWVLRILFGEDYVLHGVDLAFLAAGSAAYMLALGFAQGLIALSRYGSAAIGWLLGVVVFIAAALIETSLLRRVELSYLLGSSTAAFGMGVMVWRSLSLERTPQTPELLEAGSPMPVDP